MVETDSNDDRAADKAMRQTGDAQDSARGGRPTAAPAATDVQAYIGRQLRAVYDDVAKQPIPDRFLALMQQLETKGAG